jgi:hypothetical protein
MKKYQKIRENLKETIIENKSVKILESELNEENKKTLKFEDYVSYLKVKNSQNQKLWNFYQKEIFRKLNLNTYLNTLKSEQKLINNMKKKFGESKNSVICIGDWDQKSQMKFMEPTKGKGFRELFRKNGYEVYLVDEYNTSKKCNLCNGNCETFKVKPNPKPYREGNITVHGLLRCNSCQERHKKYTVSVFFLALLFFMYCFNNT